MSRTKSARGSESETDLRIYTDLVPSPCSHQSHPDPLLVAEHLMITY